MRIPINLAPVWGRFALTLFMVFCLVAVGTSRRPQEGTPKSLVRYTYTEYHMGVDARLTLFAPDEKTAERAGIAAFQRIAQLDSIMSDYRKDSELNRLCDEAGGPPVKISSDLMRVLLKAQEVAETSQGAFDITAAPVIQIWRKARKTGVLPNPTELARARRLVGYRMLKLDPSQGTAQLLKPGMKLDLGGIAKGDAGDQAQRAMKEVGVTRAMVEMGGDIVVSGPPPGAKGWKIRVPNASKQKGPADIQVANRAVSSSGDTEQFFEVNGVRYSHVVDPRTGQALKNRTQSTVLAREGLTTDPISTVLTVLDDAERSLFLSRQKGLKTYIKTLKKTPQKGDGI